MSTTQKKVKNEDELTPFQTQLLAFMEQEQNRAHPGKPTKQDVNLERTRVLHKTLYGTKKFDDLDWLREAATNPRYTEYMNGLGERSRANYTSAYGVAERGYAAYLAAQNATAERVKLAREASIVKLKNMRQLSSVAEQQDTMKPQQDWREMPEYPQPEEIDARYQVLKAQAESAHQAVQRSSEVDPYHLLTLQEYFLFVVTQSCAATRNLEMTACWVPPKQFWDLPLADVKTTLGTAHNWLIPAQLKIVAEFGKTASRNTELITLTKECKEPLEWYLAAAQKFFSPKVLARGWPLIFKTGKSAVEMRHEPQQIEADDLRDVLQGVYDNTAVGITMLRRLRAALFLPKGIRAGEAIGMYRTLALLSTRVIGHNAETHVRQYGYVYCEDMGGLPEYIRDLQPDVAEVWRVYGFDPVTGKRVAPVRMSSGVKNFLERVPESLTALVDEALGPAPAVHAPSAAPSAQRAPQRENAMAASDDLDEMFASLPPEEVELQIKRKRSGMSRATSSASTRDPSPTRYAVPPPAPKRSKVAEVDASQEAFDPAAVAPQPIMRSSVDKSKLTLLRGKTPVPTPARAPQHTLQLTPTSAPAQPPQAPSSKPERIARKTSIQTPPPPRQTMREGILQILQAATPLPQAPVPRQVDKPRRLLPSQVLEPARLQELAQLELTKERVVQQQQQQQQRSAPLLLSMVPEDFLEELPSSSELLLFPDVPSPAHRLPSPAHRQHSPSRGTHSPLRRLPSSPRRAHSPSSTPSPILGRTREQVVLEVIPSEQRSLSPLALFEEPLAAQDPDAWYEPMIMHSTLAPAEERPPTPEVEFVGQRALGMRERLDRSAMEMIKQERNAVARVMRKQDAAVDKQLTELMTKTPPRRINKYAAHDERALDDLFERVWKLGSEEHGDEGADDDDDVDKWYDDLEKHWRRT